MTSWQRQIYYFGLAIVEATPGVVLLTLAGGNLWIALVGVVLAGGLVDWVLLRRLAPVRQGPALALAGLLTALLAVRAQVTGGFGLLSGWDQVFGALFSLGHPRTGLAYLTLLAALYGFWRGTRIAEQDSANMHRLFRLVSVSLLLIVGLGFLGAGGDNPVVRMASLEVLTFFAVGLVTIALANTAEERGGDMRRIGWRGMLTLGAAVTLVLMLGILVGSLFGAQLAELAQTLFRGLVLIATLIVVPILFVIAYVLSWLVNVILRAAGRTTLSPITIPSQTGLLRQSSGYLDTLPSWVSLAIQTLCGLVPVALLVLLIFLARRRRQQHAPGDEERESLWSWQNLAADLRSLLSRHAPKSAETLRDALARLRDGDPASRVRRSYIRLLLAGEAHGQPRPAPQTPREYAPTARAMLPGAERPLDTLTDAYERARYYPEAATSADADAAEQAWKAIEQAEQRAKRET